jgi:hypothetical protein
MAAHKGSQPSGVISRRVAPFVPLAIAALSSHAPSLGPEGVGGGAVSEATEPSALHLACSLPFAALEERHPIDDSCGSDGSSSEGTAQALQNEAKNNFCASSSPVVMTFDDFGQLQQKAEEAHVTFGSDGQLPKDRSALRSLLQVGRSGTVGEGNVVRLAAYVKDAHFSNVSNGESVNCKTKGTESNDIHIVLVEQPDEDACKSVTAEMSPHFRPELWTPTTLNHIGNRPLRFTGQLFFDGSHRPCVEGGASPSPQRRSLFEIHPVYSVDVCRNVPTAGSPIDSVCNPQSDGDWKKLEDYVGAEVESESGDGG